MSLFRSGECPGRHWSRSVLTRRSLRLLLDSGLAFNGFSVESFVAFDVIFLFLELGADLHTFFANARLKAVTTFVLLFLATRQLLLELFDGLDIEGVFMVFRDHFWLGSLLQDLLAVRVCLRFELALLKLMTLDLSLAESEELLLSLLVL